MSDISNQSINIEEGSVTLENTDKIKRPRGRPRKEIEEPKEKRKIGRPCMYGPQKEKQPKGRPRIYEVGTILKPKDPDYWKKYYETVIKEKRNARRLVPLTVPVVVHDY